MTKKDNKYKYKDNISTSTKKFVAGTQSLNYAPDYSYLYNVQDDVYNRRTKKMAMDSTAESITSSVSKLSPAGSAITGVANTASNLIEQNSFNNDGTQDVGSAVGSNALKYGAMGASLGSAAGPIGTVIGGAVGAVGGGIYGGVSASANNKKIETARKINDSINNQKRGALKDYKYNLQGDINSNVTKAQGFAEKGKYKLKSEVRVTNHKPDDSKSSREMLKSYKRSDPNRYKLKTNKSVIVKTFK